MPPVDEEGRGRQTQEKRTTVGPFGGVLSRIPVQSRLAATIGVVVGLFASIVLSGAGDGVSMAALWIGVGGGVAVAIALRIRQGRGRSS